MTEEDKNKQDAGTGASSQKGDEKQSSEANTTSQKSPEKKVSSKTKWTIAIVMIVLVGGIATYFYFNSSQWDAIISHFQDEEKVEQTKEPTPSPKDDPLPEDAEQEGVKPDNVLDDDEITTPDEIDKWHVKRPSFIISHSAYKTEQAADKTKSKLMDMGFNSGYYWIPDYHDRNKQLFKVFVGPYQTRKDAEDMLKAVKKIQEDAYVVKLEADQ